MMQLTWKSIVLAFLCVTLLIALLFWLYLNVQASVRVSSQDSEIYLSNSLPTKIDVGNYLESYSQGQLDTVIDVDQKMAMPLKGKYLSELAFVVETPVTVDIDYTTNLEIDEIMKLESSTDLVYENKLLPEFPLKLDIPVKMSVPFQLKRQYTVPLKIYFDGEVYYEFDEQLNLPINHQFRNQLNIDDPITLSKIAQFNATMYNEVRDTQADLRMNLDIPLRNIKRQPESSEE